MLCSVAFGITLMPTQTAKADGETMLTEINFTITAPVVGETYDTNVVSAEPEKYTATVARVYDDTDKKNISDTDEFLAGHKYTYEI